MTVCNAFTDRGEIEKVVFLWADHDGTQVLTMWREDGSQVGGLG